MVVVDVAGGGRLGCGARRGEFRDSWLVDRDLWLVLSLWFNTATQGVA
jgi:hypothetical protein